MKILVTIAFLSLQLGAGQGIQSFLDDAGFSASNEDHQHASAQLNDHEDELPDGHDDDGLSHEHTHRHSPDEPTHSHSHHHSAQQGSQGVCCLKDAFQLSAQVEVSPVYLSSDFFFNPNPYLESVFRPPIS